MRTKTRYQVLTADSVATVIDANAAVEHVTVILSRAGSKPDNKNHELEKLKEWTRGYGKDTHEIKAGNTIVTVKRIIKTVTP